MDSLQGDLMEHIYFWLAARPGHGGRSRWVMDWPWLCECRKLALPDGSSLWHPAPLHSPDLLYGIPVEIRDDGGVPHLESAGTPDADGWMPVTGTRRL